MQRGCNIFVKYVEYISFVCMPTHETPAQDYFTVISYTKKLKYALSDELKYYIENNSYLYYSSFVKPF